MYQQVLLSSRVSCRYSTLNLYFEIYFAGLLKQIEVSAFFDLFFVREVCAPHMPKVVTTSWYVPLLMVHY